MFKLVVFNCKKLLLAVEGGRTHIRH